MTGEASAVMISVKALQVGFAIITGAALTDYKFPPTTSIYNNTYFDFVIVGAGTAGCVLANRLTENGNISVLLVEAGGNPPIESVYPGAFPILPLTKYDWNYTSTNDGYAAQNLQNGVVMLTAGKMLGGSSSLQHMIHYQGAPSDFIPWAAAVNDSSWNYTALQKYMIKSEKMLDPTILNSYYSSFHGQSGYMKLTRQPSDSNTGILGAFAELGYQVRSDISGTDPFGVCEPIYNIADGERQSGAEAYLKPIKHRTNLNLVTYATVTEVLIDSNNVATGVKFVDSADETYTVYANKEVIISAGAIGSPNILLHSGIGPESDLEAAGITVKKDLPVGENLQDHLSAVVIISLNSTSATTSAADPHMIPVPLTTAYKDYDGDGAIPDYQVISLVFPPKSTGLLELCLFDFKYTLEICQKMYDASNDKMLLFAIPNKCHPLSRGRVHMNTTDPSAPLVIELGTLSNSTDKADMASYLKEFVEILNTTYFQTVEAELVDMDICNDITFGTDEYWECYALAMSATMWHYSGTCSMGTVLNNRLEVHGMKHLRVVDASAIVSLLSGNINDGVVILAEKAADMIKKDWDIM